MSILEALLASIAILVGSILGIILYSWIHKPIDRFISWATRGYF